jgi:hypothetical protein
LNKDHNIEVKTKTTVKLWAVSLDLPVNFTPNYDFLDLGSHLVAHICIPRSSRRRSWSNGYHDCHISNLPMLLDVYNESDYDGKKNTDL